MLQVALDVEDGLVMRGKWVVRATKSHGRVSLRQTRRSHQGRRTSARDGERGRQARPRDGSVVGGGVS